VHFGLKDVSELPSLKEFEELAKRALGSEWTDAEAAPPPREAPAASETSPQNDAGSAESMPEETRALTLETQPAASSELPVAGQTETPSGPASFETAPHGDSDKAEETSPAAPSEVSETGTPSALPEREEQE
jgi:hypothetical protein